MKVKCPDCGNGMTIRTNGRTKQKFWSCDLWPLCDGNRPYVSLWRRFCDMLRKDKR